MNSTLSFYFLINMIEFGKWDEDLIWCPSQCYYYFKDLDTEQIYCIYLRWRHDDPWTAELVKVEGENLSEWCDWETINLDRDYTSQEYKELESFVVKEMRKRFKFRLNPHKKIKEEVV